MVLEMMDFLSGQDPELGAAVQAEFQRQRDNTHRTTGSQARHAPGTMRDLIAQWWNEGG